MQIPHKHNSNIKIQPDHVQTSYGLYEPMEMTTY